MIGKSLLSSQCRVNSNVDGDTFVGIKSQEGEISINFPIGYALPNDEKLLRKEVINLITVLSKFTSLKNELLPNNQVLNNQNVNFPIKAYMKIIQQYMNSGYYTENEVHYRTNHRGKINWSKTIKRERPLPQRNSFVYLNYVVKDTKTKEDNLISLIHEYCVYESFQKLGWLFTSSMPNKPRMKFDKRLFVSTIYDKLGQTCNDVHKELFNSMLSIINYLGDAGIPQHLYFGTDRFEYVWERLIDYTFGVENKERFFPKTYWTIKSGKNKINKALEPDTIMILNDKLYVLDAKYYRYGVTGFLKHLPESTSINKQITYGEYIAENEAFQTEFGNGFNVYNAFLMPYNSQRGLFGSGGKYHCVGMAHGDWKKSRKAYEHVQGILIDIRQLMHNCVRRNAKDIFELAQLIENQKAEVTPFQ